MPWDKNMVDAIKRAVQDILIDMEERFGVVFEADGTRFTEKEYIANLYGKFIEQELKGY